MSGGSSSGWRRATPYSGGTSAGAARAAKARSGDPRAVERPPGLLAVVADRDRDQPRWRRRGHGLAGHQPHDELGGLPVVEALVERERAPGREGQRVADGGPLARARPPARGATAHESLARGV